jgi:spermidine synthase/S-adenosylmethionine decarboxylase
MNGLHLIADLLDCRCPADFLLAAPQLEAFCAGACAKHGLTVVGRLFHAFHDAAGNPAGVTGTVVLAESHLAIHTWPEIAGVTLDVYVCNFSADNSDRAHALFADVIAAFAPQRLETKEIARGCLQVPRPA